MSNPFVRRRQQTHISVSYANQIESQNRENQRIRQNKEKTDESALYAALYGRNGGDIIQNVEELNPVPQNYQTYDQIPINAPVRVQPTPIAPLHYDQGIYELDTKMKPPQSARPIIPTKRLKEKPETTLARLKSKPLPKLAIPVSPAIVERHHNKTKSARPSQNKNKSRSFSVEQVKKINNNELSNNYHENSMMRNKTNDSIGRTIVVEERRKPFLPLHYFDNEEYDANIKFPIPVKGATLYFFQNDDELDWKNCNVVEYSPPFFKIEWDGRTKEVYRISLRFNFDKKDDFENRRMLAFKWRTYFEDLIVLDGYLRNQPIDGLPPPPPEILNNIVKKICFRIYSQKNDTENNLEDSEKDEENENKEIERMSQISENDVIQKMIQNIIEEFYFGEKLANYIRDYNEQKDYVIQKNLPLYTLHQQNVFPSSKLEKERISVLRFPNFRPLYKINSKIIEVKNSHHLFKVNFDLNSNSLKIENKVHFAEFFESLTNRLKEIEVKILTVDYKKFVSETQKLLLNWPFHMIEMIVKMIDFRVSDMFFDMISDGFESFLNTFINYQLFIISKVGSDLFLEQPTEKELIEYGTNYLQTLRDLFKDAKSVLQTDTPSDLIRDTEKLEDIYEQTLNSWKIMISESYKKCDELLDRIKVEVDAIPLYKINLINDIFESYNLETPDNVKNENQTEENIKNNDSKNDSIRNASNNLLNLQKIVTDSMNAYLKFVDSYEDIIVIGNIAIDFNVFREFIKEQNEKLRDIVCEYVSDKIFVLIDDVKHQTEDLKHRCQVSPQVIEDWYNRHLLLTNLKANFADINEGIDNSIPLFDFLEVFHYETKVSVSMAFMIKAELKNLLNKLPEFLEIDRVDLERLTNAHFIETNSLYQRTKELFYKIESYNFKTDFDLAYEYLDQIKNIHIQFQHMCEDVKTEQRRDEMISMPIQKYPKIDGIQRDLDLFLPMWTINKKLTDKVEEWMSVTFLELSPNSIISHVKKWENSLKKHYNTFNDLMILKNSCLDSQNKENIFNEEMFDEIKTDDPIFENDIVINLHNKHPFIKVIEKMLANIDYLISHIPIIQHLCNPVLRNRHWSQISEVTGLTINQNEGLTWHWIIESGIENKITQIASISRSANYEYKIEKVLTDMIDEIRSLSIELMTDKGHTRMKDTTPIFKVLSDHQVRIQEVFVPPYIKPFMMKIKEYEFLANNLRQILNRTLEAQKEIDDLAPAMESKDIRTQNQNVSANYDETVKIFNRLVSKFGDPKQFHDLISNPKYFSIIDDVQGNISDLKDDLDKVIEQKRKQFSPFRFLSDAQLIHLISFSQFPDKFCHIFNSMYSGIKQALFEEEICIGFESTDGEIVKFHQPFKNTPESIETICENFDNAITQTLTLTCFNLLKKQITNINKIVAHYPTQIVCLVYHIFFSQNVQKIFESADLIFSERKITHLNEQFTNLLNFIQTDINYLAEAARIQPTTAISNLVTVLIKQKEIINELMSEKVMDSNSFRWTRHLRFSAINTGEIEKFKVIVSCGFNSFEYGFNYTGGEPLQFVTDSSEKIYGSFMTSLTNNFNSIVTGDQAFFKTTFITNFSNLLGKYSFVYNCSSQNTSEMLENMIHTVSLTGHFLILRDFSHLPPNVVSDLAPIISSLAKRKRKANFALFATYPTVSVIDPLPPHVRLLFRPVTILQHNTSTIIQTFLIGIGFGENNKLCQQLITIAESLAVIADPMYSTIFSLRNLMITIAQKPLDKENPSEDVCKRLLSQIKHISSGKSDVIEQLSKVFEIEINEINEETLGINPDLLPSSKVVAECLKTFIEMLKFHKDVIILGSPMTGKSTIIKAAAQHLVKNCTVINPNAQSYQYLSNIKEKGLLYDAIQSSDWIIFDSEVSDEWMNILAVSMAGRDHLYFNDGCILSIPQSTRFIYETDSLSHATPSTLSYCATIVVPSDSVTYVDLINKFLSKLEIDERIIEPLSGKIIGTQIPMKTFIENARSFLLKLLSYLCENLEFLMFSKIHGVSDFLDVIESMLTVHYYSNTKIEVFDQQSLSRMHDDFENIAIFAAIWSFGAMTIDDERIRFEEKLKSFLDSNNIHLSFDCENENYERNEISYFDLYYNTTKQKWRLWEDIGFNGFYRSTTTMTDICPEYLILDSKAIVSSLYITNLLISQGKDLLIESTNEKLTSIILHLSIYTEFIGSHFSQHCFQFQGDNNNNLMRDMVDQCLSGIRDGSRSTSRLPLLALLDMDLMKSKHTELLRYILDNGFVLNLKNFTPEVTTSMSFLMTSTMKGNTNDRLLSHLTVLRVPEVESNEKSISQSLSTLCGIKNSYEIARIIVEYIDQVDSPVKFNVFHILKLIQRVAMAMTSQQKSYFMNALSYESVAVIYDFTKSEETIEVLNNMLNDVSTALEIDKYEPISEHLNKKFLSNLRSLKYRPITSLNEIATSNTDNANTYKGNLKSSNSLRELPNIFTHGTYIASFNGISIAFPSTDLSTFDQQNVLRLYRHITTPKTHILINTKLVLAAHELLRNTAKILKFEVNAFETGQNLLSLIHDSYIKAGKLEKHIVLMVNEPFLSQEDFEIISLVTKNCDIFGLFSPNEMLMIMSELHCREGDEDPFHEETIESKSNYHMLVRNFIRNCNNYFHLCIVSNEESQNFEYLFSNCSAITISMPIKALIRQTLTTNERCHIADKILQKLVEEKGEAKELPILKSISSFNECLFERVMNDFNERYEILEKITEVCRKTEETIKINLDKQLNMEKQVQQLADQIEELMNANQKFAENAQKEREDIEKEEKILNEQQKQAEILRKESEESLATTKPMLMQSTQELRSLSLRDISVIKSMNHPPRGVFLVVRSIVLIMGHKIEDKNDDPNGDQPSWILGKKILSDTSFLSNLMKQALENITPETLSELENYIKDPNFQPSIVANSSTAAKSICQFVRAIVPYHHAMRNFNEKQEELRICEENLKALQKKHDIASYKLTSAAKEIEESETKSKNLLLNKERIEYQLQQQQANVEKYKAAMKTMGDFFVSWKKEMEEMNRKKESMELRVYFVAICFALYGTYEISERDELFELVKNVFIEECPNIAPIESRDLVMEEIKNVITIKENEFGVRQSIHSIENMSLFTMSKNRWFFISDPDNTIVSLLKPIITKRLVITSFLSSEFFNELSNALLGNDLLVVYDYNWENKLPLLNEIFESCGKTIEVLGKRIEIPNDFQIIFIVEIFPDYPVFDAVMIENASTDEEIGENVAAKLFTALDPDESHDSINAVKTLRDAQNELHRSTSELETLLINNADSCLDDEKISRQFQNSSNIRGRILQQITKVDEVKEKHMKNYEKLKEYSVQFADLYRDVKINDGLQRFYDMLIHELTNNKPKGSSSNELSEKVDAICHSLKQKLYSTKSLSLSFDNRIKSLCQTIKIKPGEFQETIEKVAKEFGDDSLCHPTTVNSIIQLTHSRRPILTNCSYYILKVLTQNDRTIVSSVQNVLNGYNEALSKNKMLATVLTDDSSFPHILSVISKIKSAISLSADFRFFIFMDYIEDAQDYQSDLLSFCDFLDFNAILSVKRKMSLSMSSLSLSMYDTTVTGKTTYWRRVLFLLSFFDASANIMTQKIFQNPKFSDENFDLMVDYLKTIENPMFENIGHFFISTFYAVEQPQIFNNLLNMWMSIFNNENNFTSNIIFDNYKLPMNYAPVNVPEIINEFPIVDDPRIFGFGPNSDSHFRQFKEQKWINSKFGKMDFTSIDLKPIDVSNTVWYLRFEAEEVNKRFLHQQHRFTRGLRKLLQNLRSEKPVVDLSIMFKPYLFFSFLKHKYLIENHKISYRKIGFVLSNEKSEIELENLIAINATFNEEDGEFTPDTGSRVLPHLFVRAQEIDDEMAKIPLYHQGKNICFMYIRAAQNLNIDSVLLLTAFTDQTK
ncbi:hypothetical protein TRFO_07321 [Tritrichomonas foetus]|uniref:Dynein heavy chain family protein n=1 Tax=Tritrichomonas foetus TaxID=1144522 RepID=A0A1J4JX57_9EUKA|nr:hypothetical protein TRFO_07321 [Tritrichomonas foetus]|eukprot:OHT02116.1 hypothetical protein TRFO_07321 [Tritrichomonas foetus]